MGRREASWGPECHGPFQEEGAAVTETREEAGDGAEGVAGEQLLHDLLELEFVLSSRNLEMARDVLGALGLTAPTANALWQLGPGEAAPSMGEVAAKLGVDPSTVTFLADRLEGRGLVERRVNPANRRSTALVLTPEGARVRRELVGATAARSPMARLSVAEQRELRRLLAKATAEGPDGNGAQARLMSAPAKDAPSCGSRVGRRG